MIDIGSFMDVFLSDIIGVCFIFCPRFTLSFFGYLSLDLSLYMLFQDVYLNYTYQCLSDLLHLCRV
jgi:hypothetical protein